MAYVPPEQNQPAVAEPVAAQPGEPGEPGATETAGPVEEVNPPAIQEDVAAEPDEVPDFSPGPWSYN